MAKHNWNEITKDDVIKAIEAFDSENPEHPEPRSAFLLYEGRKYPAKHIRGMAYQIHYGREISKEEYAGGQETVRFFDRLGFETQYTHRNIDTHPVKNIKKNTLTGQVKKENNPTPKEEPINKQKPPLKIGMYLQTDELYGNRQIFNDAMDVVRKSDIDILVLPEFSYVPYDDEYRDADFLSDECVNHLYEKTLDLSRSIGRAVVVCNQDK